MNKNCSVSNSSCFHSWLFISHYAIQAMVFSYFWAPHLLALSPTNSPPPYPHYSSVHKPPRRWRLSMTFEKVRIVYNCNKYFLNKFTTLSLYKNSFINNNILSKIKSIYGFNYEIVIGSQRTTKKTLQPHLNKLLAHKLKSIHQKQN